MSYLKGLTFLLFLTESVAFSQTNDSIIEINEVTVVGVRFRHFNTGHFYTSIDSLALKAQPSANLSEIMSQQSIVHVNAYGTGSSSISARGTGEKRTPVIWNGFNIQSIMSAGIDVAQLPCFFFEDIKIQMGGSSALFGSGAAGGILYLNNKLRFNQKLRTEVSASSGSFSNYSLGTKVEYGNSFYAGSFKAVYQGGKNDFPYQATYARTSGDTLVDANQSNASAKIYGAMLNNIFRIGRYQTLKFNLWHNDNNKDIAPILSDVVKNKQSDANQHDKFTAGSAEWNLLRNQFGLWARTGLFYNTLNYIKPSDGDTSFSKATWFVNEVEGSFALGKYLKFNTGLNQILEFGKSSSFTGKKDRNRSAVFSSITIYIPQINLKYSVSGREEIIDGKPIPFTYSTGVEKQFFHALTLKSNVAKNYRVPVFNDMYYESSYASGNPDLKPETGMNYEVGLELAKQINRNTFSIGMNGFYSDMKDWMNWGEKPDGSWTIMNIDKARTKGIETYASAVVHVSQYEIHFKGMFTQMDAKDRNTDKTLTYVPKNKATGTVIVKHKGSSLMYQHSLVGKRYTNAENTKEINEYSIGNLVVSQSFKIFDSSAAIDFGFYNMWNKDYMIVPNYPMPSRNFRLGLRATL